MITYNKKGTIALTIVMLVFCLLMSVAMSYHKSVQTETIINNNTNYSDRAIDAAFSGVNYAMAIIQAKKSVFGDIAVTFSKDDDGGNNFKSRWISLSDDLEGFYDMNRKTSEQKIPPYRFIVSCAASSYDFDKGIFYIKSYGEYLQYDENDVTATYSAQIIAECYINKKNKTINLKKYKKTQTQNPDKGNSFYTFVTY